MSRRAKGGLNGKEKRRETRNFEKTERREDGRERRGERMKGKSPQPLDREGEESPNSPVPPLPWPRGATNWRLCRWA